MTIKLTRLDLDYILTQIQMAEAGQDPVNPLLSFGLREVAGTNNNLAAGQSTFGSSLQPFPTLTDPMFQNAQVGTSYAQTSGLVVDAQPRMISELIASQNASNPAAACRAAGSSSSHLGAGYQNHTLPGADGIYGTADDTGQRPCRPGRHHGHRRRHHDVRQPGDPDQGLRQQPDRSSAWRRACSSPT